MGAVVRPILQGILQGYNGCILAYGQTGSGKTHTITGALSAVEMKMLASGELDVSGRGDGSSSGTATAAVDACDSLTAMGAESSTPATSRVGMLPRLIAGLFDAINDPDAVGSDFTLTASSVEIYRENIRDLLAGMDTSGRGDDGASVTSADFETGVSRTPLAPLASVWVVDATVSALLGASAATKDGNLMIREDPEKGVYVAGANYRVCY
jgi:hypothetical protein